MSSSYCPIVQRWTTQASTYRQKRLMKRSLVMDSPFNIVPEHVPNNFISVETTWRSWSLVVLLVPKYIYEEISYAHSLNLRTWIHCKRREIAVVTFPTNTSDYSVKCTTSPSGYPGLLTAMEHIVSYLLSNLYYLYFTN